MNELAGPMRTWESFYVIVGSSAGALTGLQFVVLTLIADLEIEDTSEDTVSAFGTPTVIHFCSALLISAILAAPWTSPVPVGVLLAALGMAGVIYTIRILLRARRQAGYQPVMEDWVWHTILPGLAYLTLLPVSHWMGTNTEVALFPIGGAALLLVLIGIHNAYDSVTYITLVLRRPGGRAARPGAAGKAAGSPSPVAPAATSSPPASPPPS